MPAVIEDKYYPVEDFLTTVQKYDLHVFCTKFFHNLKSKNGIYKTQFEKLMKSYLYGLRLTFIIEVLTYLSMHNSEFQNCELIKYIIFDEFFDNLVRHVYYLYEQREAIDITKIKEELSILVKFYDGFLFHLPVNEVVYEKVFALFQMTFKCLKIIGKCDPSTYDKLKVLIELLQEIANFHERKDFFYTNLNVFPKETNLHERNTLLPSIVMGPYENSEQYLDIHFKLLRENCFQELRDDLEQLKKQKVGIIVNKKFDLYRKVQAIKVCSSKCRRYKICHDIIFSPEDTHSLRKVNWKTSKKFMNGSLLFFSRNDFTSFIMATVEVNFCAFTEGHVIRLSVSVIGDPDVLKCNTAYDLLEPSSFFAPYYYSLRVLQMLNPHNFPFAQDIILATKSITSSPLSHRIRSPLLYNREDLNKSQHDALKACLSQKFTLVQGPPGTGKSYLTRKLLHILTKEDSGDNRPVLVICMRNRSLDIILEPIVKSGIKVLRLGRSENELLEKYSLYNYKKRDWKMSKLKKKASYKFIMNDLKRFRQCLREPISQRKKLSVSEELYELHNKAGEAMRLHLDYYDASKILAKNIQVIGATTTGAAKRNGMLSQINPKAVIIEEAAEIHEPFVVSSLPTTCDHLILIGDHMQLQPISRLPKELNLHVSLFERMVKNGKGFNRLTVQHRMRPEIAQLICPLIYDDVTNHESVNNYPDVLGISKNVFFINHAVGEVFQPGCMSYYNGWEGDLVLAFASYLSKQGYKPSEITILTAYSAQQHYLIKNSDRFFLPKDIQIQTIDNYQGDENLIIILSLVRSHGETIGFLSKANRVNVALSRAKMGLYMFGDMGTLQKFSSIWLKIHKILRKQGCIAAQPPLCCQTHKHTTLPSYPEQITCLKYGGCSSVCGLKKDCGHYCDLPCHPNLGLHKTTLCKKPCLRMTCGYHGCSKKCYEDCGICNKPRPFNFKCGHTKVLKCSANIEEETCIQACRRKPCGKHACPKRCFEKCPPCNKNTVFQLPCGHNASLPCSSDILSYKCRQKCRRKSCSKHKCQKMCFEECHPCEKELIYHLKCGHTATLKCSEDFNSYKCVEPCIWLLPCEKHPCPKKCWEECEKYCGVCGRMRPCGIHECANIACSGICHEVCNEIRFRMRLKCDHWITVKCSTNVKLIKCLKICGKPLLGCALELKCEDPCHHPSFCRPCIQNHTVNLPCGHSYTGVCSPLLWHPYKIRCFTKVNKKYSHCEHSFYEYCNKLSHPIMNYECPKKCTKCTEAEKCVLL